MTNNHIAAVVVLAFAMNAWAQEPGTGTSWSDLSIGQQTILAPYRDGWDGLPADKQRRLADGAQSWSIMARVRSGR